MIAHHPPGDLATLYYDTITGGRRLNTDYLHICDGGPSLALAVADGDGDHADAAQVAQITAQIAAAVASSTGVPVEGLRAARTYVEQRNMLAPAGREGVSTATVVAINRHRGVSLAWAGDTAVWGITPRGEVVALTEPCCPPRSTPCHVARQHAGLLPHSRTVGIEQFRRLVVATSGMAVHLRPQPGDDTPAADRIGTLAGTHEDGGYALAQLLWLAERSADPGNATVAVIDLLDHHRATTTTTIAATTREDCLR
ncbi:hypothetical protein [Nonomuraea wenchangensis]|uniref:hypothetical protein n=1 Tax=Nonomuraea wenchangensis TaxID=568860 RepID=UPI0033348A5C